MQEVKELSTVYLDPEKCKGCVNCMKRCPTDAIRVRNGVASVIYSRCIGCGECIRICPHGAKLAAYDPFESIMPYEHKVALVPPSFYAQFGGDIKISQVRNALIGCGFTDVVDVGGSAELATDVTKVLLSRADIPKPVLSTACPAIVELVSNKFRSLVPHLLNVLTPVDITSKFVREKYDDMKIDRSHVGVFFISPCPAKVYAIKSGTCVDEKKIDGVLAVTEVYKKVLPHISQVELAEDPKLGISGLEWAKSGGEADAIGSSEYLAADGIENVINILNSIEDGQLQNCEFIELNACHGGCVGGVLNVENPYVAKARLRKIGEQLPEKVNYLHKAGKPMEYYLWENNPYDTHDHVDRFEAMSQLVEFESIVQTLPTINCGLCGAPSCSEFAYDIVSGLIPKDSRCPIKNEDK